MQEDQQSRPAEQSGPATPPEPGAVRGGFVGRLRARARSTWFGALVWRIGVSIVGFAVVAGGILLLPLPGPGWLVIFAGLGILATEYTWAARLLGAVRSWTQRSAGWLKRMPRWERLACTALVLVLVADLGVGAWFVTR